MAIGLKDDPLAPDMAESLGLADYADALAQFIIQCDTPITISIQGDWGSGKTSLMHLIEGKLAAQVERHCEVVWFNTWLFSQFGQSGNLPLAMLTQFIQQLSPDDAKRHQSMKLLSGIAKASAVALGGLVGQGESIQQALDTLSQDTLDVSINIRKTRADLEAIINTRLDGLPNARVVVFVDDLDRLVPENAVELLEAIKLFLDIPGCVFVLACDYEVVMQGLVKKFGIDPNDTKGRNFFDKIIQVPFLMPTHQYNLEQYFQGLLAHLGFPNGPDEVPVYVEMARHSIGFNPRTIKRLFNSLQLLHLVLQKKAELVQFLAENARGEWQRILFGTLCLQLTYPQLFDYLNREPLSQELFTVLGSVDSLRNDPRFADLRAELDMDDALQLGNMTAFISNFSQVIQLAVDGNTRRLSQTEIHVLKYLLSFSSVVAVKKPRARKADREAFLEKCSTEDRSYFTCLLDYLGEGGQFYQNERDRLQQHGGTGLSLRDLTGFSAWGVTGFSIRDRTGKAIFFCYPTQCKRNIELLVSDLTPAQSTLAIAFLQRHHIAIPANAKIVSFTTQEVSVDDLIAFIEEIRDTEAVTVG